MTRPGDHSATRNLEKPGGLVERASVVMEFVLIAIAGAAFVVAFTEALAWMVAR